MHYHTHTHTHTHFSHSVIYIHKLPNTIPTVERHCDIAYSHAATHVQWALLSRHDGHTTARARQAALHCSSYTRCPPLHRRSSRPSDRPGALMAAVAAAAQIARPIRAELADGTPHRTRLAAVGHNNAREAQPRSSCRQVPLQAYRRRPICRPAPASARNKWWAAQRCRARQCGTFLQLPLVVLG